MPRAIWLLLLFCPPTLCKVIFHLSHVKYDAVNLDGDRQGTPWQNTVLHYPPHRHTDTYTQLSVRIQLCDTSAYLLHDTALIDRWPAGPLFVLLLCLHCSADSHLPVTVISTSPPQPPPTCFLICVMLALAQEESLRRHSTNRCQANRQTWCQPSQLIIPALLLTTWTEADWSAGWLQPKYVSVAVWYISFMTHCQLFFKKMTAL